MEEALQWKEKGNTAFAAKNFEEAIDHFTQAIALDSSNQVLFSNRSASYSSIEKYEEALVDANKTIELKPEWPRGYSRKGTALHGLGRLTQAGEAYEEGLKFDPENQQLKDGLKDIQSLKSRAGLNMFGKAFEGDMWLKLKTNPQTAGLVNDPALVETLNKLQQDPSQIGQYLGDQRVLTCISVLMGGGLPDEDEDDDEVPMETDEVEEKKPEPQPEPVSPQSSDNRKSSDEEKVKGNEAYKKKDFDTAIQHYTKALEIDPENVAVLTNMAAVHFEQKEFSQVVADCKKAIEEGKKVRCDYVIIARAWARMGNAYTQLEEFDEAISAFNSSLVEKRDPNVLASRKKAEQLKKEKTVRDLFSPEESQKLKAEGNVFFQAGQFPEAMKKYEEAITRNPKDHLLYSNRAACFTKLARHDEAIKDCDRVIEMQPDFVKAYIRKGNCQFFMKDYKNCIETYKKGLNYDPNNAELKEGLAKANVTVSMGGGQDKEAQQRAMADPEIQGILQDPAMQQVLKDMQENPAAAQSHMSSPVIADKIQKLIAAGVLGYK